MRRQVQTTLRALASEGLVEKQTKGVYLLAVRADDAED